ncbi:MAG: leucine-rich repeat protein [Prevotella sp.]|jgi:hypothetical protein|nr:leucine-rich repeat protein [Prevotella sp.]MCI1518853.1 leucine-rich repeat protein [Prevotella sp.]MCI1548815.1 leucine-rich repeat protein [Prevotella sp.]MCI1594966.1 leucine-rich repeat protein [Prevotella sp.]MCI2088680.1 leucine-rich repeat protein [Prevotella sp.]
MKIKDLSLLAVFAFLFCSCSSTIDDRGVSLTPATEQIVAKGLDIPADGVDTTLEFPLGRNTNLANIYYFDNDENWCKIKCDSSVENHAFFVSLLFQPSQDLLVRKSVLSVTSGSNIYHINIRQKAAKQAYAENSCYVFPSTGGDFTVTIKSNTNFTPDYVWRLVGYGDTTRVRSVDWMSGSEIGDKVYPSSDSEATLHFHVNLNTGLGRTASVCLTADSTRKITYFKIRQEPRSLKADETHTVSFYEYDPLEVIFGRDKENLSHLRHLTINGYVTGSDVSYLADLVNGKDGIRPLDSLDLSNSYFEKSMKDLYKCIPERLFFGSPCHQVKIPGNTVFINKEAFACCNQLTSFTIPASVKGIGDRAFALCGQLKEIIIPKGSALKKIGDEAFNTGTELESIYLPATINYISNKGFVGLRAREIHAGWTAPPVLTNGFVTKGCTLYVPKGCVEKYRNAQVWGQCDQILEEKE